MRRATAQFPAQIRADLVMSAFHYYAVKMTGGQ